MKKHLTTLLICLPFAAMAQQPDTTAAKLKADIETLGRATNVIAKSDFISAAEASKLLSTINSIIQYENSILMDNRKPKAQPVKKP